VCTLRVSACMHISIGGITVYVGSPCIYIELVIDISCRIIYLVYKTCMVAIDLHRTSEGAFVFVPYVWRLGINLLGFSRSKTQNLMKCFIWTKNEI
jgi:hypothetical protein